jgi:hypothetical protein
MFKKLHGAFVSLGVFPVTKSAKVPATASLGIFFAGVKTVLSRFQFPNHKKSHLTRASIWRAEKCRRAAPYCSPMALLELITPLSVFACCLEFLTPPGASPPTRSHPPGRAPDRFQKPGVLFPLAGCSDLEYGLTGSVVLVRCVSILISFLDRVAALTSSLS